MYENFSHSIVLAQCPPPPGPTLAGQLTLQAAGVGLYLGLAIIQVVGAGGIATFRRRLRAAEEDNRNTPSAETENEINSARLLITRLEIDVDMINGILLAIGAICFVACTSYFAYCNYMQDHSLPNYEPVASTLAFIGLPITLFTAAFGAVAWKSRDVHRAMKSVHASAIAKQDHEYR